MSEDARPFFQSLFALGVSRGQRTIVMGQAAVIAAAASGLGALVGICAGWASMRMLDAGSATLIPIRQVALLVAGAVIGAAALAALQRPARSIDELIA